MIYTARFLTAFQGAPYRASAVSKCCEEPASRARNTVSIASASLWWRSERKSGVCVCGADAGIQTGGEKSREHPASLTMVEGGLKHTLTREKRL